MLCFLDPTIMLPSGHSDSISVSITSMENEPSMDFPVESTSVATVQMESVSSMPGNIFTIFIDNSTDALRQISLLTYVVFFRSYHYASFRPF